MNPIRLARSFLTVGLWTMASRVLGFMRDILIAKYMGTGAVAEAFLVAFSLPNMFRRFFAEGAFNMAFVPMFSKKLEGDEDANGFARDAMMLLAAILILFTILAVIFMPALVLAMASGFIGDERFDLAVLYGRIVFVYILFISLAALLSGVLNASGRFAAAAAAPVFLNVILIAMIIVAQTGLAGRQSLLGSVASVGQLHGDLLAVGVVLAGIVQFGILFIAARRAGFGFRPRLPRITPDMKRLAIIAAPAALAGGVVQVNLLIGRQVASFFDGAVAWLSFADRLYQLPLGVVGIAISVVLLPDLSRRLRAGDTEGGRNAFNRAGEIALTLTVPAAFALAVIPVSLVSVLFERGEFGQDDVAATAFAAVIYGMGLPAFVFQKVLQPLYFAREDTRTPFKYALWSLLINATVAIGLSPFIGFLAAAVGTTVAAWGMAILLWRGSYGMGIASLPDDRFFYRAPRIFIASALMSVVLLVAESYLAPALFGGRERYAALALLVAIGMLSYGLIGRLIGAFTFADLKAAVKR